MESPRDSTREVSYAHAAKTAGGRAFIRTMENATGRLSLLRRAEGYQEDVARGRNFWQVMLHRYGLTLDLISGDFDDIPRSGPLVVVANHPYGILDGLVLGHLLSSLRGDFRILAHGVFRRAPELERAVLPISFDGTKEATALNLASRRAALEFLGDGGAVGVFPSGTVATSRHPLSRPLDTVWRTFTSKMISKSGATVVPIYFDGGNSRLFQVFSHLNYTMRMGMMIREFRARVDTPVRLAIGAPVAPEEIAAYRHDPKAMMKFLRDRTYALDPARDGDVEYGHEFEAHWKD